MQELLEKSGEAYSFETVETVRDKMRLADDLHKLIPEESVQDLEPMDVSGCWYCKAKRVADLLLSAAGLLVLLLPMAVISAVIYLDNPGPVFFSQYRVGRSGRRFKLYKFRTMKTETPKYLATSELEDPDRYITRVGHILRKTSLDEIPQLFNVLRGDMSLVGPRPLISDEYEIHNMRMRFGVYTIRPGVTGLAQVNGRDLISAEEKLRWDMKYLKEFGPVMDVKVLLATVPKIFRGADVVEGAKLNK